MPNHVYNLITLKAKTDEAKRQLHTFIDKNVVSDGCNMGIDNQSIIPLPDGITRLKGMSAIIQMEDGTYYKNPDYSIDAEKEQEQKNLNEYGYRGWYDFCCNEWGSKWGFYDCTFYAGVFRCENKDELHSGLAAEGNIVIRCNTAWTPADGLLHKICDMYPDIEMYCAWADENVTESYGEFIYDSEQGFTQVSMNDMDVRYAYDMLVQLGLISGDGTDGYFINENGVIIYDESRDKRFVYDDILESEH